MVTMTEHESNTLRPAHDVLAAERRYGEILLRKDGDNAPGAVSLTVEGGVGLYVSDEYDVWEVSEGAVHVGYVWATYADEESVREGDYVEHDGGLTERELLDALDRARALARHRS